MTEKEKRDLINLPRPLEGEKWDFSFKLNTKTDNCNLEELTIKENGRIVLQFIYKGKILSAYLWTYEKDEPLILTGEIKIECCSVCLQWKGCLVQLWVNERVEDEEWPIGSCIKGSNIEFSRTKGFCELSLKTSCEKRNDIINEKIY